MKRASLYVYALMIVVAPAAVLGQGGAAPGQPAQGAQPSQPQQPQQPAQAPTKRMIEIRGRAPAPEVVTVRPRELPEFERKIVTPALYDAPPPAPPVTWYILLPGTLPEPRAAAPPNPPRKPF